MSCEPLRLLLADDDKDDCFLFREALEELPIPTRLTAVHNGEQLMQLLHQNDEQLPDILFLDLNMPRKNGFQCLEEIKQNEKLKLLRVVIYSTSLQEDLANQLYENGAQHYLKKPSEFAHIKEAIHHVLNVIAENDFTQPPREMFVLSHESLLITPD